MSEATVDTGSRRPLTSIQAEQTRAFVNGLNRDAQPYWDMVTVGDELSRDLHLSAELVVLYADGVEEFNPWYEGWTMNSWHAAGASPFGSAIVPPMLVSHFVLSVQFDHTKPFAIGSIHTFHDTVLHAPIPVGSTVRILTRAVDKFEKRGRRYVRHEVTVTDCESGLLYMTETRDILSL